ncbi:bifunctional 5,10-methylenetetrahydrofolate dehydrogenase/5,10-methenyltetrahydrofolate cyclohydrolase [Limnoglobus roseus]|uniref:Bifunctional protein FolD n=1 Tax=Limnoglobus roseus TaxID=2598579 RepID=A0A5C1AIQ2_9BACT|nr:bifunctional 5,10-methylenetetrahydrofolate dehydrogenase/5,10-methenyltetrahydrofolate cyclohydrolase [Limnoglobus roseus]QEL18123.1 bifunctional 5,10-methylenetetrahydrofolate dehydrogenase/5,10-methenyltetrahydrofolate cyclohydrolase [Limnoglobus roseus]
MTANRLDGKALAQEMRREMAKEVSDRVAAGKRPPGLAAVLVGENPSSHTYVRNKRKSCDEIGMANWLYHLPGDTSEQELLSLIDTLNADPAVHGILVQLPLPKQIREEAVIHAVTPLKDVDCFHPENVGRVTTGHPRYYPCTPHGVVQLVSRNGLEWSGKQVVVLGRSNIVGKPLALMLMQKATKANPAGGDATVTVAHTRTANLAAVCRGADVLIAAVGQPGCVTADMVKPGAVVVDVGTTVVDGKLRGDVDPKVTDVAGWLSPVPGGVGPMTITMLLYNTLRAAERIDGSPSEPT